MENSKDLVLDINTDTFKALKDDFNEMLMQVLYNLQDRELVECDMGVKLNIKFDRIAPPAEGAVAHYVAPQFKHEIQATFKQTAKKGGSLAPAKMELVFDEELNKYVLRTIDDGQQDLFNQEQNCTEEPAVLPEGKEKKS